MVKKLIVDTMLKTKGIVTLLFLFITLFLFIADTLFLNHKLEAETSSQQALADSFKLPNPSEQESDSQAILSTSYKRYSLFRYNDFYILCEPYTVQRGDWVYKIFRSKGELSKEDFGLFMRIFKNLNPEIKDTNTIKVGQNIIIPLKKSKTNDFKESQPGVVELPTITLSQPAETSKIVKKPISNKRSLTSTINNKREELYSEIPIRQLKQFALLHNGRLMLKGKYYFPRDNRDDLVIDVAINPLVQFNNGSKILFVPERNNFEDFTDTIQTFWRDFKIMEFSDISSYSYTPTVATQLNQQSFHTQQSISEEQKKQRSFINEDLLEVSDNTYVPINLRVGHAHKDAARQLLEIAGYNYTPEKEISISIGNITVTVNPGIIKRDGKSDILLVFGDIYGSALESLKKTEHCQIIAISPLLTTMEVAKKIFSSLGASTTDNPSFVNPIDGKTVLINGMYVKADNRELFITPKASLIKDAFRFLNEKKITIVRVDNPI